MAVAFDIHRARKLKNASQIGVLYFIIESWVSIMYLFGSVMFLMGSVFSYPVLYTPHTNAMFLTGSFLFILGSVSCFTRQMWRYIQKEIRLQKLMQTNRGALIESTPGPMINAT
jgi:membrane-bound ClpP family serine protease